MLCRQAGVYKENYTMQIGRTNKDTIQLSITAIFDVKQSLNNTTCWSSLAFLLLIIINADFHIPLLSLWLMMLNPSKSLYGTLQWYWKLLVPQALEKWLACMIYFVGLWTYFGMGTPNLVPCQWFSCIRLTMCEILFLFQKQ